MSIYTQFETHDKPITLKFGTNTDGTSIEIDVKYAGEGNTDLGKAMERLVAPYRAVGVDAIPVDEMRRILATAFGEAVVVDWRNVRDRDGVEIAFNKENATKLLRDLPSMFSVVQREASKYSNFRAALLEADKGN